MTSREHLLTAEQVDFLTEVVNVGAGNAATALAAMLRGPVSMAIPRVHVIPTASVDLPFGDPTMPVVCVRMGMVGELAGALFFIVPTEHREKLAHLVQRKMLRPSELWSLRQGERKPEELDLSVVVEVGNVIAGAYFTAVHSLCGLNVFHTVPTLAIDMMQALLDEALAALSSQVEAILLIENELVVERERITNYLVMLPSAESVKTLVDSIEQARMACSGPRGMNAK